MVRDTTGHTRRRRFLELAGTAGAIGLAGCSQGGGDGSDGGGNGSDNASDGSDGSDGGGGPLMDDEFTNGAWMVPKNHQWNPYSLTNYSGEIATMSYDPLAVYNNRSQKWVPNLATEWSLTQGEKATVTLREQSWWNGDSVLAKDLEIQFKIDKHLKDPLWDLIDGVSATGDHTLELSLPGEVNEDVLLHRLLRTSLHVRRDLFEKKLKALEEASSEKERNKAIENTLRSSMKESYGHGPYKLTEAGSSNAVAEKFEDHPNADKITVPKYGWWKAASNQQRWAALKGGRTDGYGSTYTPPKVVDSYPDHIVEIKIPTYADFAVAFNHTREPWGDVRVRRAVAHVVDRKAVAEAVGPRTRQPVKTVTGTSPYVYEQYFDDNFLGQLNAYETDTEKAAQLLRDAGLSKQKGKWAYEGSPLSPGLVVHSGFSDFVSGCQQVVGSLDQFGIDATIKPVEGASYGQAYREGDWDLFSPGWGAWNNPYPFFDYQRELSSDEAHKNLGYPSEVEVPPVGKPDGSPETVNVDDLVAKLGRSTGDQANELIRKCAWIFNQTLPKLQCSSRLDQTWITNDHWEIPDKDATVMGIKYPSYWLARTGKLGGKTK